MYLGRENWVKILSNNNEKLKHNQNGKKYFVDKIEIDRKIFVDKTQQCQINVKSMSNISKPILD